MLYFSKLKVICGLAIDHIFLKTAVVDPNDNCSKYSILAHSVELGESLEYLFRKLCCIVLEYVDIKLKNRKEKIIKKKPDIKKYKKI